MIPTLKDLTLCLYLGGCPCAPPPVPSDLLDVPADLTTPAAVFEHVKAQALARLPNNIGRPASVIRLAHVWAAMVTRTCAKGGRFTLIEAAPFLTHLEDARNKGEAVKHLMVLCPDLRPITAARLAGVEPMTVQRQIRKLDRESAA